MNDYELDHVSNEHLEALMRCLEDIILLEATAPVSGYEAPKWIKQAYRAVVAERENRGMPWNIKGIAGGEGA